MMRVMWRAKSHYTISLPIIGPRMETLPVASSSLKIVRTLFSINRATTICVLVKKFSVNSSSEKIGSFSRSVNLGRKLRSTPRFGVFEKNSSLTTAKCISSASSPISPTSNFAWNDTITFGEDGVIKSAVVASDEEVEEDAVAGVNIPVRAFFVSTSVDLASLAEQNKQNFVSSTSRMTNYVVLRFGDSNLEPKSFGGNVNGNDFRYAVVFQYGSIVLFNVRDNEVDRYLKIVRKHAFGLLPETRKDDYEVREKPTLNTWMQGGLDYIMLQYLDINGIRIIGSVLGQSIALDYYVRQVDGMVAEFTDINRDMEKTGKFKMQRKKLFQLVGKANSNLADVILKLGLFERSDIAWKDAKYAQIWEYLRDEFELTQRFASLDFKLKFVEHNIRFLQEILQNRRSDFLEWVIIILISVEIIISVYDIAHRSSMI